VSEFLALLTDADRRALEAICVVSKAPRGRVILAHGQVADKVVVLRDGRVKVVAPPTVTGDEVVLTFRGPGALFGELSLVDGGVRNSSVVAIEPVEYLVVAASAFRAFLEHRATAAFSVLAVLSRRLRDADLRLTQFASADTLGRVSARLLELCDEHGERTDDGSVRITLPLTQEELAGWAGASLEATVKSLRTLRELGWIETRRRAIVVHDLEAMRARAA
jgi:CRP/FNR family transcriptional regulator, cyclic AMP receptor protein